MCDTEVNHQRHWCVKVSLFCAGVTATGTLEFGNVLPPSQGMSLDLFIIKRKNENYREDLHMSIDVMKD